MQLIIHSGAVCKSIEPEVSKFEIFRKEQDRQGVVGMVHHIQVALTLQIFHDIGYVVLIFTSELIHTFKKTNKCSAEIWETY